MKKKDDQDKALAVKIPCGLYCEVNRWVKCCEITKRIAVIEALEEWLAGKITQGEIISEVIELLENLAQAGDCEAEISKLEMPESDKQALKRLVEIRNDNKSDSIDDLLNRLDNEYSSDEVPDLRKILCNLGGSCQSTENAEVNFLAKPDEKKTLMVEIPCSLYDEFEEFVKQSKITKTKAVIEALDQWIKDCEEDDLLSKIAEKLVVLENYETEIKKLGLLGYQESIVLDFIDLFKVEKGLDTET